MKTFDRAMYAIFLLVLLADVARGETVVPAGNSASSVLISRAAAQSSGKARIKPRVGPAVRAVARQASGGDVQIASLADARNVRAELLSSYRIAYRRYVQASSGSSRNLFDGQSFALIATFAPVDGSQMAGERALEEPVDAPVQPVLQHTSSPAP